MSCLSLSLIDGVGVKRFAFMRKPRSCCGVACSMVDENGCTVHCANAYALPTSEVCMNEIARDMLLYLDQRSDPSAWIPIRGLLATMRYSECECMTALVQLAATGLAMHPSRLFRDSELETKITEKGQALARLLTTTGEPLVQVRAFPYEHLGFTSYQIEILPIPIDREDLVDKIVDSLRDLLLQSYG